MAKFIDYYKIMGVAKDATQAELKLAYKKRTKQFHPDLHPDDPKAKAKFQMVNEAYEVLKDPDKRARYDQYGENWNKVSGEGFGTRTGGDPFGGGFNPFGGTGGGSFRGGGGGYEYQFNGGEGFSDFFSQLFGSGFGGGRTGGRGRAGFSAGTSAGAAPSESQASIDIDMYTAILGGEVIIQSDSERLKLKLKPGTQPGQKMRLKGKGGGGRDLILTVNVKLPTTLSDRQKSLLEEMRNG